KAKKSVKLMMEKLFRMELELMLVTQNKAVHKELGDNLVRAASIASSLEAEQDNGNINKTQSKETPNESSSLRTTLGGGPRVLDLEKTKTTQHNGIGSLKRRVKKLEKKNRNYPKQEVAANKENDEVNVVEEVAQVSVVGNVVSTAGDATTVSAATTTTATITTVDDITLAQALMEIKSTKPKEKGVVIQELIYNNNSFTTITRQRLTREKAEKEKEANISLIETWDDIQAKINADHQLAKRLQA
ncbi:hypothetical protein Tco_0721859, partial [Tanacetum coccineum]